MITGKPIKIAGMGVYLPPMVESAEIERRYAIPQGWSHRYSGVLRRHHVKTESNGYMGARAAEKALDVAGMKLSDIDLLISAGGTFDYPLPNQASIIKSEMKDGGRYNFPAIDLDNTCLSFVAAFEVAAAMLDGKSRKNILIVSAETASKGLNEDVWETITLFGDGAAAAVVSYDADGASILVKGMQRNYSEGVYDTIIRGGGNRHFFRDNPYDRKLHSFDMKGKHLLKLARIKLPEFMSEFYRDLPFSIEDTKVIIPHQASKLGLHLFKDMYKFHPGQVKETLENYGNCIAASIPLTLCNCIDSGEIKRGDYCLLIGTAAGFAIGAVLIRY